MLFYVKIIRLCQEIIKFIASDPPMRDVNDTRRNLLKFTTKNLTIFWIPALCPANAGSAGMTNYRQFEFAISTLIC